jgi:hypothetical protein
MSPGSGSLPQSKSFPSMIPTSCGFNPSSARVAFRLFSLLSSCTRVVHSSFAKKGFFFSGRSLFQLALPVCRVASRIGWVGGFFSFLACVYSAVTGIFPNWLCFFIFYSMGGSSLLRLMSFLCLHGILAMQVFFLPIRLSSLRILHSMMGLQSATYCAISDFLWCLGHPCMLGCNS